jgi:hypothetical protein
MAAVANPLSHMVSSIRSRKLSCHFATTAGSTPVTDIGDEDT